MGRFEHLKKVRLRLFKRTFYLCGWNHHERKDTVFQLMGIDHFTTT